MSRPVLNISLLAWTLMLCLLWIPIGDLEAQKKNKNQGIEEEMVRYMGYEETPTRYLSLPYDMVMNHNVERNYVDIGFFLLCLLPILWFWRIKSVVGRVLMSFGWLLMTLLAISSSMMINNDLQKVRYEDGTLTQYISSGDAQGWKSWLAKFYEGVGGLMEPLRGTLASWTQNGDHITYPLMILILGLCYWIYARSQQRSMERYLLGVFLLVYALYGWFFSGGVVWYVYILLPLLLLDALWYGSKYKRFSWIALVLGGVFILMSYALRQTNIYFINDEPIALVPSAILEHNMSGSSEMELYNAYFPNVKGALERINADKEGLVLQAGTSLKFLIQNNHERVIQDPLLNTMNALIEKYKYKTLITKALNVGGVKYIIMSPNLIAVDQTPEKTLSQKFYRMISYLDDNPNVRLMATDRIVKREDGNGVSRSMYHFFGEELIVPGQYAIFEVLDPKTD